LTEHVNIEDQYPRYDDETPKEQLERLGYSVEYEDHSPQKYKIKSDQYISWCGVYKEGSTYSFKECQYKVHEDDEKTLQMMIDEILEAEQNRMIEDDFYNVPKRFKDPKGGDSTN